MSVIPGAGRRYESNELQNQTIPPMRGAGWNPEIRAKFVLAPYTIKNERLAVTELPR